MTERCLKHKIFIPSSGCPICKEIAEIRTDFENRIVDKNLEIIELKKQINNEIEMESGEELIAGIMKVSKKDNWPVLSFTVESILYSIIQNLHEPEKRGLSRLKKQFEIVLDRVQKINGTGLDVLKRFWGLDVVCMVSDRVDSIIEQLNKTGVLLGTGKDVGEAMNKVLKRFVSENQIEKCKNELIRALNNSE
jgi:hypothetical protein